VTRLFFSDNNVNFIEIFKNTCTAIHIMAKFDGIKGQELLDIEVQENELTFIFKDNRYLFVKNENGKMNCDSLPE
jgi:hypothetical protein